MSDRRSGQWVTSVAGRITAVVLLMGLGVVAPLPASAAPPANDNFASPRNLGSAVSGNVTGVNLEATKELGEPDHAGNAGGHSVWYRWTAPADGNEFFSTFGSDFDTLLAAYTGASLGSLTTVASNDDVGGSAQSAFSFHVTSGVTYLIAVDGFSGKVGHINLTRGSAPANDNFADAQRLSSATSGSVTGTTLGATPEAGEPLSFLATIWYTWTAPRDGTYKFDTVGSTIFDTILGVYRGSTLDALTQVGISGGDRDRPCCTSWVPIRNATAGTTYSIFVGAFEEEEGLEGGVGSGSIGVRSCSAPTGRTSWSAPAEPRRSAVWAETTFCGDGEATTFSSGDRATTRPEEAQGMTSSSTYGARTSCSDAPAMTI